MYRLIIADDEELVRNGLMQNINWERLGFEVVAQFEDGQDIIDYLKVNRADVVFTDVQMYEVSGLEVARWVAQNCPKTKVVILSGYKEFEYVKDAMEAGVLSYALKPIELSAIEGVFTKVKRELDCQNESIHKNVSALFTYRESGEYKKVVEAMQRLLNSIVLGDTIRFDSCYDEWMKNLQLVMEMSVPALIYQLFNCLYERLDKVYLPECLRKDEVYRRIDREPEKELYTEIYEILLGVMKYIHSQMVLDSASLAERAKLYIEQHISESVSLQDVANSMYVSRSKFTEEFKRETGENFMDYLIHRRMELAKELLKLGKYSGEKLAQMVGYSELKYFQKCFKKYTGYSVKEYQRLFCNEEK